jgi:hypothetical protein
MEIQLLKKEAQAGVSETAKSSIISVGDIPVAKVIKSEENKLAKEAMHLLEIAPAYKEAVKKFMSYTKWWKQNIDNYPREKGETGKNYDKRLRKMWLADKYLATIQ